MRKKIILATVALVLFAAAILGVRSEMFLQRNEVASLKESKVYRVGIFSGLAYFDDTIIGFQEKMAELGYIEGRNITYDIQRGEAPVGNQERLKKFVHDNVDLILVYPTEASLEAKEVTRGTNIPIISTEALVEGNGLIESVQHPGDNITGVRFPIQESAAKRLEILHELAPEAKRIWVPYLKDYPTVMPSLAVIRSLAASLGLTIIETPFQRPSEIAAYLKTVPTSGDDAIDAVLFIPEPISIIPAFVDQIYAFTDVHQVPVAGVSLSLDDTGPLFSLIPDGTEIGRLAAPLADKIFRGVPAGTIPIVTPEPVLEINYRVAQKLGLSVSESLLSMAKRIVH